MKKNILILIFLFNISPNIQNNQISLNVCSKAYAQWNSWGTGCWQNTSGGSFSGNNTSWWSIITGWINDIGSWIGQQWNNSTSSSPSSPEPWSPWLGTFIANYNPNENGIGGSNSSGGIYPNAGYTLPFCPITLLNGQFVFNCNGSNLSLHDCDGVAFGFAYLDSCNKCVGGTTGLLACKGYLDSNNIFIDSVRKQPCDSLYKKMGDSLYAFLNKPEFQDSLNKFMQNTAQDTVEKAISFGRDSITSAFKSTPIKDKPDSGFGSAQINLINTWPGIKIYKMMHYHHNGLLSCFSTGDLYSLQNSFNISNLNQINSNYAYGAFDSSMFAMQIEDSLLYSQYLSGHPKIATLDYATSSFNSTTNIGTDFLNVKSYFANTLGLSDDDALTQATAFVFSKYNTGMVMYRKRKNENKFSKINTKETIDTAGNKTYSLTNCL